MHRFKIWLKTLTNYHRNVSRSTVLKDITTIQRKFTGTLRNSYFLFFLFILWFSQSEGLEFYFKNGKTFRHAVLFMQWYRVNIWKGYSAIYLINLGCKLWCWFPCTVCCLFWGVGRFVFLVLFVLYCWWSWRIVCRWLFEFFQLQQNEMQHWFVCNSREERSIVNILCPIDNN